MNRELLFREDPEDGDSSVEYFKMTFRDRVGVEFNRWKLKADRKHEGGITTYTRDEVQVELQPEGEDGTPALYYVYELTALGGSNEPDTTSDGE